MSVTPSSDTGLERLRLLASAIAGRAVEVLPVDPGQQAWTDGATIFIEPSLGFDDRLRVLSVQASLLGAGSLAPDVLAPIVRRPALARRYLMIEGSRAMAAASALLPGAAAPLINHELAARTDSPTASMTLAAGRERVADPPSAFGTIRPRAVRSADVDGGAEVGTPHAPRVVPSDVLRSLDDDEDDEGPGLNLLSSPFGGGGALGRLLKRFLGDARSSGSGPPGADAPTHHARPNARPSKAPSRTSAVAPILEATEAVVHSSLTYPEWDVHRRRYRREWCSVSELDPPLGDRIAVPDSAAAALRRPLARLGMAVDRRHRQLQGIDIDIDAAVSARVEALAGSAPDDAVYIDAVRCRRDLAVLVLLDVSGSAGEPSASGGTVHEHQQRTAAALTSALHELGDRVALYAFRSQGRSSVQILPIKRFGDPLDARVAQRLGGCVPGAYTRVGAAIRHSSAVLEREAGMSRRLLVVLSDGFAYDHGYAGSYGEADARRALAETRRRGTGCVCLSVGAPADPEALRRVFGTAAHAGVRGIDDLGDVIGPLFQFALRSADAQRAVFQRRVRAKERLGVEGKAP